jgi:hypothetical protein
MPAAIDRLHHGPAGKFHELASNGTGARPARGMQWSRATGIRRSIHREYAVMEEVRAAEVLKSLAAGMDPADGSRLPEVAALQSPDVVRALFLAAESLEMRARLARRNGSLPRNAGKTWSQEEDSRLLAGFDGGSTVEALAAAHERTRAGIEARLIKHGRLEPDPAAGARMR